MNKTFSNHFYSQSDYFSEDFSSTGQMDNNIIIPPWYNLLYIYIKTLAGDIYTVIIDIDSTIIELKSIIADKAGAQPNQQCLIFAGKQLEDYKTLNNYGIIKGSSVNLIVISGLTSERKPKRKAKITKPRLLIRSQTESLFSIKNICKTEPNCDLLEKFKTEFKIDPKALDPEYDYDFTKIVDKEKFYKGGREYFRPCGWYKYALKVKGKYENDDWFSSSDKNKEWAICYHGTDLKNVESIIKNGFKIGDNNKFGKGVYCTPNVNTAAAYTTAFTKGGKKYKFVFQTRVKPSAIVECSKNGGPNDYWLVKKESDIRPYSICIIEIK